jgi:purine catabolism regulator
LTIRHLLSTPDLDLTQLADGAVDRAITWVHVSELADPTPFLSGGELLLTTGLAASTDGSAADSADRYVQRLVGAAVVGVGFGTGLSHEVVPADLVAAARRHGLALIEVPHGTPFIAISRAVSGALAADEYAAVTRTFTAQQALTRAALSPSGPDELIGRLARQVSGWVVLLDRAGDVLAASADLPVPAVPALAPELAILAAHTGPVSSAFAIGADTVSLQSVGAGARGRAFLAVGRAAGFTPAHRHLVNAAVMLLTIMLEQSRGTETSAGRLAAAVLRLVLAGRGDLAAPVAAEASLTLPPAPVTVLVAVAADDRVTDGVPALRADPALHGGGPVLAAELDGALVALLGGTAPAASEVAARLAASSGVAVGLSAPAVYDDIATAHRHARQAAEFGAARGHAVTSFADISMPGISGMLGQDRAVAFAESLLQPLIEHDRVGRGDLVASLRTWLAHHGQWDPSAAALGVHRHTLRHRIRTAEQLLGRSLDAPGTRSELWLALEVLDTR